MDQGLSHNSVYCIHQDRTGFIWLGTFAGLNRYDGNAFSIYKPGRSETGGNQPGTLKGSVIFALAEDAAGRFWVGTDGGGLSRYDQATDRFTTFRKEPGSGGLPSDRIFSLAPDGKGGLWIGTGGGGLAYRDSGSGAIHRILSPPGMKVASVRCLQVQSDGGVLAGTEDGGLLRYVPSAERFERIALQGHPAGGGTVRALAMGLDHRAWIGTAGGDVEVLEPGASRAASVLSGNPSAVRALAFDAQGRLWVGYESDGIEILDVSGRIPRRLYRDRSLGNVRAVEMDRNGLLWIALKDGGVLSHDPRSERFTRFSLPSVRGMVQTRSGDVLAGTDGSGLFRVQGGRPPFRKEDLPKGFERIYSVIEDRKGRLWIGTDGAGLLRKDPGGSFRVYLRNPRDRSSLSSNVVWALHEDRAGRIWVGTEGGGLDRWDPASDAFIHYTYREDDPASLLGSSVRAVDESADGRLWVGTWDGGLSRFDPATGRFERFPLLADSTVNALLEDSRGRLWVGTGSAGLALLGSKGSFTYVSKKDGLAGDTVNGILEDAEGTLWVATAERLSRYDPATGAILHFGEEDGLADSECSQNAYLRARNGALWIGGPAGITRFFPEAVKPDPHRPEVVLTRVETYGPGGPSRVPLVPGMAQAIDLDWRNMGLRFQAAVLDFASPARNRYAMRIEGQSDEWLPLDEQHGAVIPPLPPGTFVVRVKGSDGNGVWSTGDATLTVRVRPPFWRHPVAWIAGALGLGAAVWGIMLLRMRALARKTEILRSYSRHIQEAREEERISAARDVHDEIGQHLAALNLQAYWVQTHPDAPEAQRKERMGEILESISEAMNAVKTVATNLRPIALDALAFDEAVSWYIRSFEHRGGAAVSVEIAEGFPKVKGAPAIALFRVLQEMLTNVSRHARATKVAVRLGYTAGTLSLEVADDGTGITPGQAEADDSFGIIGMRERCAAFGGELQVRGVPGAGSTFSARIPFPLQETSAGRS
ncbi:MAG TPA: two-component regulator propeller domain-containing protein [Holophaga sp.]|nr:two-component regulator propeller domain-containing protein [Holophaga sp.]HPS67802.1 two-component regulator propeller domain-containing protein [Holophaga sp.]